MNRKKVVGLVVGGMLTLATVFGAVNYRVVLAQTATPTASAPAAPNSSKGNGLPGFGRGMAGGGGVSDQSLAAALGISLDTLQAAQKTARDAAIKQAVTDGLITQAQADQLSQQAVHGQPFGGLHLPLGSTIDENALLAKALGISTDQLQAASQKAYAANIDQAVKDGSMTQAQADAALGSYILSHNAAYQSALKSAYETAVKQAVTDGTITQAQADAVLKNNPGIGFGGLGMMGGVPGGHGGPGMRGGGAPGNPPNSGSTSPSAPSNPTPAAGSGL